MNIYITSQKPQVLALWKECIPPSTLIEYRDVSPTQLSVDAILMAGSFAFERYGGRPQRDVAQILPNRRNDNLPNLVIIPPYRPVADQEGGGHLAAPGWEDTSPAFHAISRSLLAIREWNSTNEHLLAISTVNMSLPFLGMNDETDQSTPMSAYRALSECGEFFVT
ncbi:hypothetical protein [Streptomyces chryseus]|uniref:Uncharacterized protein n=1 Tax=Streptomyces chryseus TaxID=68186 RepID=A0ABQ3ECV5_9ACTN|nr:hypothetical protein [Streptomyces chryseus]GHB33682.1 hypothetical protein GCM10010346_66050 [Streptomyces chryseus]